MDYVVVVRQVGDDDDESCRVNFYGPYTKDEADNAISDFAAQAANENDGVAEGIGDLHVEVVDEDGYGYVIQAFPIVKEKVLKPDNCFEIELLSHSW